MNCKNPAFCRMLITLVALAFAGCQGNVPEVVLSETRIDFGEIDVRDNRSVRGMIRYKSDEKCRVISNTCGCMKVISQTKDKTDPKWWVVEFAWTPKQIQGEQLTDVSVTHPDAEGPSETNPPTHVFTVEGKITCPPKLLESGLLMRRPLDQNLYTGTLTFSRRRSQQSAELKLDIDRTRLNGLEVEGKLSTEPFIDGNRRCTSDMVVLGFKSPQNQGKDFLEIFWEEDEKPTRVKIKFVEDKLVNVIPEKVFLGIGNVGQSQDASFVIRSDYQEFPSCDFELTLPDSKFEVVESGARERVVKIHHDPVKPGRVEGTFIISFSDRKNAPVEVPLTGLVREEHE